jgi:FKBP-type peptidyl-prolyl cis-trans isomerase
MKRVHWPLIALALLFTSCRDVPVIEVEQSKGDTLKENMITANRYISQGEEAQIDAYVQRRGWEMQRLLGGARVMVSGERRVKSGERRVESGERRVESGERRVESGERRAESGERRVESGKIDYEDVVAIEYDVESISGQVVYSNVQDTVTVGRMQPTRGLDAALRTLAPGQQAVVILPSEQAYGVVGDGDRIGSRMILIYKIHKIEKRTTNTSNK